MKKFKLSIKKIIESIKIYGFKRTFNRINDALTPNRYKKYSFDISTKKNITHLIEEDKELTKNSAKTINWVIKFFEKSSGGHRTIMRFIYNLEKLGFECRLIFIEELPLRNKKYIKEKLGREFFPIKADIYLPNELIPPAHFTIATEWETAYWVKNFSETIHKCYFVQDFEPWFHPKGSKYIFAEETYRFNFKGITAGDWLKEKLEKEYGMISTSFKFSFDKELHYPLKKIKQNKNIKRPRILFYARPSTSRRGFELGILVLAKIKSVIKDAEIVFIGEEKINYDVPFEYENFGSVSHKKLPEIYRSCDLALIISLTNLSLLPTELMACGVPVVSNDSETVSWFLNSNNSVIGKPTQDSLANSIIEFLNNPSRALKLINHGLSEVENISWENEAKKVGEFLSSLNI